MSYFFIKGETVLKLKLLFIYLFVYRIPIGVFFTHKCFFTDKQVMEAPIKNLALLSRLKQKDIYDSTFKTRELTKRPALCSIYPIYAIFIARAIL